MTAQPSGNFTDSLPLANITVLGVPQQVSDVTLNGHSVTDGWSWDNATQVLSLTGLDDLTSDGAWNSGWELNWTLSESASGASGSSSVSATQTSTAAAGTGSGSGGQSAPTAATGGSAYLVVPAMSMFAVLFSALIVL